MAWFRWDGADLILQVRVDARAARDELVGAIGDSLRVRITAPPVEGRANAYLLAFLARQFGTRKTAVTLLRGHKTRTKLLRVRTPTKIPAGLGIR
jgi:uncharacterized protein (TIGR00251 family)